MFHNILVPVDGSTFGEHAIPWALAVAAPGARIHLVHVHLPPAPMMVEGVVVADPTLDESMRTREVGYLAELEANVRKAAPGRTIDSRNLDTDDPVAETLASAVREIGADLVVMVTHARGPFARFWLGSVTDDFSRVSPVPVLLYHPPEGEPDFLAKPTLNRIIVPLDGSDLAERIVAPALALGQPFGAEYTLLLVLDAILDADAIARIRGEEALPDANPLTPAERAEHYLERTAQTMTAKGASVSCKLVREGTPATVVLDATKGNTSTAIAIATHGRGGLTRLVMGSVTDAILRGAKGPVFLYHPPG